MIAPDAPFETARETSADVPNTIHFSAHSYNATGEAGRDTGYVDPATGAKHPYSNHTRVDNPEAWHCYAMGTLWDPRRLYITRYNPLPVATRDSTLQLQTEDALVIGTLEKIRKAHGFNMLVGELAHEAGVTTRTLEARFRAAIGRSVGDVIRTSCLEEVKNLVENTDTPFAEIAKLNSIQAVS